ncbi:MAG: glycosyltransferase, partial [Acetobacteraceae bacterium]
MKASEVTADGWWEATGPAAAFRLLPGVEGLPKGWLRLTIPAQGPRNASVVPGLKVDTGSGFQPLRVVLPRRLGDGSWTLMVHLPPNAVALSMSPPVAQGPFRLGMVQARPTNRPLVGARLALSLGQRWLQEPQQFRESAGSLQAAWRSRGRAGLRQALGQAMLGSGPVTAAPVISITDRYQQWIAEHEAAVPLAPSEPGRITVLIPVASAEAAGPPDPAQPAESALAATLASLQAQPGLHWDCRIGFAPGTETALAGLEPLLTPQITRQALETAERGAMLAALAAGAGGALLLVLDPGDQLTPEALATLASVPEADVIHGDEDRIAPSGRRSAPGLKPEWSPELLEAFNYFGRPTALRRDAVEATGGFTPGLGAGAEWDLHLRLTAAAARVARIARILCHRPAGTPGDRPAADGPAAAELRAVLAAHWQRQGIAATVTTQPDGTQRATWPIAAPPLVSVVIPNKDQPVLLEQCLRGLLEETRYPAIEIIVVDSGSSDPATLALYARLEAAGAIRVVPFLRPFNYSAACNAGAAVARGALLLFLNNDIAVTRPDWLEELVRYALRPGVGVVGTMLVYPDGQLQHAGVVIGMHLCGLLFRLAPEADWGPIGSPMVPRTVSAIMGACQMVRREVFAQAGGFDETLVMANSDVALCLAARAGGWRTAYTPFARLIHHEGASRGHRNPVEDLTRTAYDIRRFGYHADPYFHPALDADSNIPRLRVAGELGNAAALVRELRIHSAGMASPMPLDLANDAEVAEAVGLPASALFWPPVLPEAIGDRAAAARWCLTLLRRRQDLRRRFPDALSAGAEGAFARWLGREGGAQFGLSAEAVALVLEALGAGLSARARQAVLVQGGLAGDLVLAFLPPGRASLLGFLLRRDGLPLALEEIWWLALECAEDPARELLLSYRFNPGWQGLFPDGLTVFGQDRMAAWFRATYRSEGGWTDPAQWPVTLTPAEQIRLG